MTPRRLLIVLAAVLALPVTPAAAATHVLRPVSTRGLSTWTTTPAGAPLYSVLDDALTRPAKPGPGDEAKVPGAGPWWDGIVGLSAPDLAAGERPTTTRIAVYAEVGQASTLTATLWHGLTSVDTLTLQAGAKAGWYTSTGVSLDAGVLGSLALGLHVNTYWGATQTRVMVATAEVDAIGPPAPPADGPAAQAGPAATAAPTGDDEPAARGPAAGAPAADLAASGPVLLAPGASVVPLALGCRATVAGGCRGTVVLRLAPAAPTGKRARAARCARGCRVIGEGNFSIAAGKRAKVKVRIAKAARNLFARNPAVRATAVITTRDASGSASVVSRAISIRRSG